MNLSDLNYTTCQSLRVAIESQKNMNHNILSILSEETRNYIQLLIRIQ